jgi:hypothetical protein
MDLRYAEQGGNRNLVLAEVVDKLKEHVSPLNISFRKSSKFEIFLQNDRVKEVHDEMVAHRQQQQQLDFDADKQASLKKRWIEASNQRSEYLIFAETRIQNEVSFSKKSKTTAPIRPLFSSESPLNRQGRKWS